tara:strand:- start:63 stop:617 length:555 start_codon:yes stop_codon:yes gene_type:complete
LEKLVKLKKNLIKNRISKAHWIWFQFSKYDTDYLNKIKKIVNKSLKGPKFSVHLTTIGPFLKFNKNELKKVEKISKKMNQFKVNLLKYALNDQKFTALFIKIKRTKKLLLSKNKFSKTNYIKENKKYNPHISLYYGEENNDLKKKVIKKLPKLNKFVTIDKICIVDVNEKINKWKIIKKIKLKK